MTAWQVDAVVFDFDGVLIESTDIKTHAFRAIYSGHGEEIANAAVAYHLEHQGTPRYVKFCHLHETLLGIRLADEQLEALSEDFSALVCEAVIAAPWVPGAREFVEAHCDVVPMFVASSTPHAELEKIVDRRNMARYFRSVHGTPARKSETIERVALTHGLDPARVLMVGDALEDLHAAQIAGARFVGRAHGSASPFPPGTAVLSDLNGLERYVR